MTGTFSSLSTTLSALRYNRVAMDVAGGNVANVGTEGYARRNAVGQAQGAPSVPAMWSRWDGAGNGVSVGGVERMVDPFLDARGRLEHGTNAYLQTRSTALVRVESQLGEPGDEGVAAALTAFQQAWHDISNNPGDGAARSQLLGKATSLTVAIGSQARAVTTEWANQQARLEASVTEANALASDLASVNEGIKVAKVSGTDAGLLLDKRDQITMRLAELVGGTASLDSNGLASVQVGGAVLVAGSKAGSLDVRGAQSYADTTTTDTAINTVRLIVQSPDTTATDVTESVKSGSIGGQLDLLRTTLPDYMGKLDAFVVELAAKVNDLHAFEDVDGERTYDQDGNEGGDFFGSTDPSGQITASTLTVLIDDPRRLAASRTQAADGGGTLDGSNADRLGSLDVGGATYRELVTKLGAQVSSARNVSESQSVLTSQIDAARESISGINIDEEMVNLLAAQRAYEGAARVMTTIDSVLDTLINRTGVTR
jgi:flagellar hook-associated protein 1 FlgK